MKILLENVRSIESVEFEMPETGLVQFIGPNSHGKSVLADVLVRINSKTIMSREEREENVIRKGCSSAFISIAREDGYAFLCKVHSERHESKLILQRPDGTKITRSLREGGWDLLLGEFGFMVFNEGEVCMQIHETFGEVPMITTSRQTGFKFVESISTDSRAKDFVESYKGITHVAARETLKKIDASLASYKEAREAIVAYDYLAYREHGKKMRECCDKLKGLSKITLAKISIPPVVEILDIKCKELIPIPLVEVVPVFSGIECLKDTIKTIDTLTGGVCPLCEREF